MYNANEYSIRKWHPFPAVQIESNLSRCDLQQQKNRLSDKFQSVTDEWPKTKRKKTQNFRKIPFCIRNSRINLFMCHIFFHTANWIRSIECWNSWLYKNKSMSLPTLWRVELTMKCGTCTYNIANAFVTKIIRHSQSVGLV